MLSDGKGNFAMMQKFKLHETVILATNRPNNSYGKVTSSRCSRFTLQRSHIMFNYSPVVLHKSLSVVFCLLTSPVSWSSKQIHNFR